MLLSSGWAFSADLTVACSGCTSLRDFGNFGAAQLFRASGPLSASVGNDRIWVFNSTTGARAFVDLDTPVELFYFLGIPLPIPDFTKTEINATWLNGSESATWVLPNEVIIAIGESIGLAEEDDTPEVSVEELSELPGFNDAYVWQFAGFSAGLLPVELTFNRWSFSILYGGARTPIVTVYECAWTLAC
jgi:hypothetical protein